MTERVPRGRRRVDGVLLLDKPAQLSSNAALQKAKHLLAADKAGHTGTLDPFATGLLPLCFGEATKFAQGLLTADKTYLATLCFGRETTTGDSEGEVVFTSAVSVTEQALCEVLARFTGDIEQVPPMFSALKYRGRPLYELARQGIEIERAPRRVFIHALRLVSWEGKQCVLEVSCSKGTYIRSLAIDIGRALGCGASLTALRRTRVGRFDLSQAVSLAALEALAEEARAQRLLPIDTLIDELPRIEVDAASARHLRHGRPLPGPTTPTGLIRLYGPDGFLGVGEAKAGRLLPHRLVRVDPDSV